MVEKSEVGRQVTGKDDASDGGLRVQMVAPEDETLERFNLGAFCIPWMWSIGHRFWPGVIFFPAVWLWSIAIAKICSFATPLPVIVGNLLFGLVARVFFGVKGNEWAGSSRK